MPGRGPPDADAFTRRGSRCEGQDRSEPPHAAADRRDPVPLEGVSGFYEGEVRAWLEVQEIQRGKAVWGSALGLAEARVEIERGAVSFTVSIGVTDCAPDAPIEDHLERADKALYRAKNEGRDRVVQA